MFVCKHISFPSWRRSLKACVSCGISIMLLVLLMAGPVYAAGEAPQNKVNPQQLPDSSFIYDTPIEDLANADSYYEGQIVQVRGEVIGDRIWEGPSHEYCWISLISIRDGQDETISVLMTPKQAKLIDTYGHYGARGTILQVKGVFHLVCKEHAGESDLHAIEVKVVEPGVVTPDVFDIKEFYPGIILVALGLGLTVMFWYLQERGK